MPETVYQIYRQQGKPTYFLPRRGTVSLTAPSVVSLEFWLISLPDLITYCEREGVPFTVFEDWQSILATTKAIL